MTWLYYYTAGVVWLFLWFAIEVIYALYRTKKRTNNYADDSARTSDPGDGQRAVTRLR